MIAGKTKDEGQEKFLMRMYSSGSETDEEEFLGGTRAFFERIKGHGETLESTLHEAAVYIEAFSQFGEVAIGVRGQDGMYRYSALVGFNREADAARRGIAFTSRDMKDLTMGRPIRICRISQFYLSEKKPYQPGQENTFNRPNLVGAPRQRPDEMVDGDFVEIPLIGKNKEIIGWIEVSGTMMGKLPKRAVMIQIEFFASCLSLVLSSML
jgi:hypothetical protein